MKVVVKPMSRDREVHETSLEFSRIMKLHMNLGHADICFGVMYIDKIRKVWCGEVAIYYMYKSNRVIGFFNLTTRSNTLIISSMDDTTMTYI